MKEGDIKRFKEEQLVEKFVKSSTELKAAESGSFNDTKMNASVSVSVED